MPAGAVLPRLAGLLLLLGPQTATLEEHLTARAALRPLVPAPPQQQPRQHQQLPLPARGTRGAGTKHHIRLPLRGLRA